MTLAGVMLILLPVCCLLPGSSWAATLSGLQYTVLGRRAFGRVSNFSTFLMDPSSGVLFMGARDTIVAVDTNKLNQPPRMVVWDVPPEGRNICMTKGKSEGDCRNYILLLKFHSDGQHIYVCGTYAFDPKCAFLERSSLTLQKDSDGQVTMEIGKKKIPYDSRMPFTAVMTDDALYAATSINFRGTEFIITRATGPEEKQIRRTEQKTHWLDEPEFVSSSVVELSADDEVAGEDDRIFFFFNEVASEYNSYSKVRVPRVARVCRSDVGGLRTLHADWTTFLKAELVCEDKVRHQRFDVLVDVFTLRHSPQEAGSTHFYGLFTTQCQSEEWAVCVFSVADIIRVMDGPFKKRNDKADTPTPMGSPRPGQCLNNALKAEGFDSSLKIPDNLLAYVKNHPLKEQCVNAAPILIRKGVTYTKVAASLIGRQGSPGEAMLFLGTDFGELHVVAVIEENATLLREIALFDTTEAVNDILLHQGWALVGTSLSLARIQTEDCALYSSCKLCARFAEVGCHWDASQRRCQRSTATSNQGDVIEEALRKCDSQQENCSPPIKEFRVSLGLKLLLPCPQLTPRPCRWEYPHKSLTKQRQPDLEVTVTKDGLGSYVCTCQEGQIHDPIQCRRATYQLTLEDPTSAGAVGGCGRHVVAFYILFFFGGFLFGMAIFYFVKRRRGPREVMGRDAARQQSGVRGTYNRNGNTCAIPAQVQKQGNGSHHSRSMSAPSGKTRNGSIGNTYVDYDVLSVDVLDGQTARRETSVPELGKRESIEGAETDEGPEEGMAPLDQGFSGFPMFKKPAPLAPCEESSI
ncbi:semaphorin-4F [Stigmatopora nigra]